MGRSLAGLGLSQSRVAIRADGLGGCGLGPSQPAGWDWSVLCGLWQVVCQKTGEEDQIRIIQDTGHTH